MRVTDGHDMTLAVKVALNPNISNPPTAQVKLYHKKCSFRSTTSNLHQFSGRGRFANLFPFIYRRNRLPIWARPQEDS